MKDSGRAEEEFGAEGFWVWVCLRWVVNHHVTCTVFILSYTPTRTYPRLHFLATVDVGESAAVLLWSVKWCFLRYCSATSTHFDLPFARTSCTMSQAGMLRARALRLGLSGGIL